jgi:hypothetical protein
MKTNMLETSLSAYSEMKEHGKATKQTEFILSKLEHGRDYTLREIQALTGLEINVVSGRVNDIKKDGLLQHSALKRKCTVTGKLVQPVLLTSLQLSLDNTYSLAA